MLTHNPHLSYTTLIDSQVVVRIVCVLTGNAKLERSASRISVAVSLALIESHTTCHAGPRGGLTTTGRRAIKVEV